MCVAVLALLPPGVRLFDLLITHCDKYRLSLYLSHTFILEIIPLYGMSSYITREDQYSKPPHKKLKDRQIDRQNRLNSPPSMIHKSSCATVYNGYGKGHSAGSGGGVGGGSGGGPGLKKTERRARSSPKSSDSDLQGNA